MASACRCRFYLLVKNSSKISSVLNLRNFSEITDVNLKTVITPKVLDPAVQLPTALTTDKQFQYHTELALKAEEKADIREKASAAEVGHLSDLGQSLTVDARRVDPTTVRQVYYFDSLNFVKALELRGFTREQAEGLAESLTELVNTTLDHQSRHMITKKQQEIVVQQLMAEIVSVKKDLVLLQKSEFSQLQSQTEKMGIELNNLKKSLMEEISKLKGHIALDINLERGRSQEAHGHNAGKLQELKNKIDTDVANLKTLFEQYRNDVLKFAGGTVLTCATFCLGIVRLWN